MKMNEASALHSAYELAKLICANPSTKPYPNKDSAKDIAEFIDVLSNLLAGKGTSE